MKIVLRLLAIAVVCSAVPLSAHHGTGISYDASAPPHVLKGVVTEFAWRNPHVSIFMDVKDADGKVTNWGIELSNVASLAKEGYHRNTLKPGMEITAYVTRSKSGAPVGLVEKVVLADGKEVLQRDRPGQGRRREQN